jgi:hypothetical protein
MPSGSTDLLELVRELKAALGSKAMISVAAIGPASPRLEVVRDQYWSIDYTVQLCAVANEVVIMGYDTWLRDPAEYRRLISEWTASLSSSLSTCEWRMGVPAYEENRPHHRPEVESLEIAIGGVIDGFTAGQRPESFRGLALYAGWTIDAREWAAYDSIWRGRAPTTNAVLELPSPR